MDGLYVRGWLLVLCTLVLTGLLASCGGSDGPDPDRLANDLRTRTVVGLDMPGVTRDLTAKPVVSSAGGNPRQSSMKDVVVGDGASVQAGQVVDARYVGVLWPSSSGVGQQFTGNWSSPRPSAVRVQRDAGRPWAKYLAGTRVGGRVAITLVPADAYGAAGDSALGVGSNQTVVFVVDVTGIESSSG